MSTIPVICDRCRSTGVSGEGDFSHLGDLLEFTPVPRKTKRIDGWNAEKQRAFIAALAATGSKRRAAMSIGMAPYGVDQLLKSEGNDGFKSAFDRAMAIARQNGTMRIAQGVADAAARSAYLNPRSGLRDHEPEPEPEIDEEEKIRLIENLAAKFMKKVAAEREARLGGEIVAADFYLRQITFLEATFDLTASQFGWDARNLLSDLRRGGQSLMQIVDTPFANWLDTERRIWWLREGDPERPPHPDARFTVRHDQGPWGERGQEGYSTYVDQHATGALTTPARGYTQKEWAEMGMKEQLAARQRQYDEDAAEQREWERRANEEWERRQLNPPRNGEGDHAEHGGGAQ